MSDSHGRLLRVEEGSWRKDPVLDSDEGWQTVRLRWALGRVETARERGVDPYLHDHHRRAE